jgi:hypothetical protein
MQGCSAALLKLLLLLLLLRRRLVVVLVLGSRGVHWQVILMVPRLVVWQLLLLVVVLLLVLLLLWIVLLSDLWLRGGIVWLLVTVVGCFVRPLSINFAIEVLHRVDVLLGRFALIGFRIAYRLDLLPIVILWWGYLAVHFVRCQPQAASSVCTVHIAATLY